MDTWGKTMWGSKGSISNSSSSIKLNSIGLSKRENCRCIMVKVGAIVHNEKSN